MTARFRRAAASIVATAAVVAALAACSADPLAEQYRAGDNKGFIAADGLQTVSIPVDERTAPIEFTGTSDTGETVTSDHYRGDVLVVNFWYATCGPCIAEAPLLEESYLAVADQGVHFLGINKADQAPTSLAFAKDNGVTYPSLIATGDPDLTLAFAEVTPLNATPVTLVIDREGRVAARVIGAISTSSILTTLVKETLAENG